MMTEWQTEHNSESSGKCCYWYRKFPATPSDCHKTNRTTTVTLFCEVEYRPPNKNYSIEINWYKSRDEKSAGVKGEILNDTHKYLLFDTDPILMNQMNETSIRQYWIEISKFNSSDRGYYWCQMVVNNVTLSPSPYGHINDSQCLVQNVTCNLDQPLCAQNTHTQYMAFIQENSCSLINVTGNIIQPTRSTASSLVYITTQSSNNDSLISYSASNSISRERMAMRCDQSHSHVCAAGIVTGLILMLSSLTVIALCIFFIQKNRRHQGMKNIYHHYWILNN